MSKNVIGTDLQVCCDDPKTGFYRTGSCDTGPDDAGMHTVCVLITEDFLEYSKSKGNDLSTPVLLSGFKGLKENDRWCVCLSRWVEAYEDGRAPMIYLRSTHISALEFIDQEVLNEFALDEKLT